MKTILSTILISLALLLVGCDKGNKKEDACETELATCRAECLVIFKGHFPVGPMNCISECKEERDKCKEKSNDNEEETAKEE